MGEKKKNLAHPALDLDFLTCSFHPMIDLCSLLARASPPSRRLSFARSRTRRRPVFLKRRLSFCCFTRLFFVLRAYCYERYLFSFCFPSTYIFMSVRISRSHLKFGGDTFYRHALRGHTTFAMATSSRHLDETMCSLPAWQGGPMICEAAVSIHYTTTFLGGAGGSKTYESGRWTKGQRSAKLLSLLTLLN